MIQIKHNKLRIPTGGRLTSWLFTKRVGGEFSGREEDLNPEPPDYKSSALPLGHARLVDQVMERRAIKALDI